MFSNISIPTYLAVEGQRLSHPDQEDPEQGLLLHRHLRRQLEEERPVGATVGLAAPAM